MSLRVAALQLAAHDRGGFQAAWPLMEGALRAALDNGAQLAVLPEGTLPAYVLGPEPYTDAEIAPALERIRELARAAGAVVVVGAARTAASGTTNSAIVIDADGSIAGAADKHFLWHFDRRWFRAAGHLAAVDTKIGRIGALICADGRIPTIARALTDRGAQILVMPTAWVTSGRDPRALENVQADLLGRVRARENAVPFVAANKCGIEQRCVAYCGKSQIVAADGTPIVIASQDRQEIVSATLDLAQPRGARALAQTAYTGEAPAQALRIAVMARALEDGDAQRLCVIEADRIVHPGEPALRDDVVLDPGGLAALRLRGATFAVWATAIDPAWQVRFARARALELRMYLAVIDEGRRRAFAVDPDGAVLCGTFGSYDMAAFAFDPARAQQTLVAPGTDVLAGLARAAAHA
ncbi:MAG: carbon-nitrogen hydrolase family protein [Candidatus Baltobacteraceae bacterium]